MRLIARGSAGLPFRLQLPTMPLIESSEPEYRHEGSVQLVTCIDGEASLLDPGMTLKQVSVLCDADQQFDRFLPGAEQPEAQQ